jgi:hypothetical protein
MMGGVLAFDLDRTVLDMKAIVEQAARILQ